MFAEARASSANSRLIRRGSELDKSEAAVFASSEERTAFPFVPVPLEYVNESSQGTAIAQFTSDDVEPRTDRPQCRPAMVTGDDLANAEHRRQKPALTTNAPFPVKVTQQAT